MPEVREGDLATISAPIDFLGVNNYTSPLVAADENGGRSQIVRRNDVDRTDMGWEVVPQGLEDLLVRLHRDYAPAAIYVTENGAAYPDVRGHDGNVNDPERQAYLEAYIAGASRALAQGVPLWHYLSNGKPGRLPLPEIQIFGGGAHAARRVDVQDFMIVCPRAASCAEALDITAQVYATAGKLLADRGLLQGVADEGGYWPAFASNEEALDMLLRAIERAGFSPGADVAISLDIAASSFGSNGRYRLALEGRELDSDGLIELLGSWIARYPIVSIEDPVAEDDAEGFRRFTKSYGARVQVVGDDFLVTDAARVRQAAESKAVTTALIKPNQAGTLTETHAALTSAREAGLATIVSARSGESEDVTIVHLAVGWDAGQLKVGSFSRSERMAKWNEALRIEEALGPAARFAGGEALGLPASGY